MCSTSTQVGFSCEKNEIYVATYQHKCTLNKRAKKLVNSEFLRNTLHRDLLLTKTNERRIRLRPVVNLWMLLKRNIREGTVEECYTHLSNILQKADLTAMNNS